MNTDSINAGECSKENMINVEENQTHKEDSVNTSALSMPETNVGETKTIQSAESSEVEKYLAAKLKHN